MTKTTYDNRVRHWTYGHFLETKNSCIIEIFEKYFISC